MSTIRDHRAIRRGEGDAIKELLEGVPDLTLSVSATTGEPREGEEDGRDYHFLSPEEFERRIDEDDFLEFATYSGNRYGTLRSEVERCLADGKSVVLEIEVQGAQQVRGAGPTRCRSSSPRPTRPLCAAASRAGHRLAEAIDTRLETAEQELAVQGDFDHRIVNDDLAEARPSWRRSCAPSSAYL